MARFAGSLTRYPARSLFIWYVGLIFAGSFLLTRSFCRQPEVTPISWIDAAFTATSASCVTGLSVRSTANEFSFIGQAVIALLIQLGGIGIITLTTFFTVTWTGREGLRQRAAISETLGSKLDDDLLLVIVKVVGITFVVESIGICLLWFRFSFDMPWRQALWTAIFTTVSAFCNAGFALHDLNLIPYAGDWLVNLTVMSLIVIGGIGFPVIIDVMRHIRRPKGEIWEKLSLHTKLVLIGTVLLLTFGASVFLILEWNNVLAGLPLDQRILISMFQSVTPRTAGFNTVDYAKLTDTTLFITILLMAIGAAPCSTAGGFKVSTFMVLTLQAITKLRGLKKINIFRRSVSSELVDRANASVLLFFFIANVGLCALLLVQESAISHVESRGSFLEAMFEVVSALGTVGLSMGYTMKLSGLGKFVIILMMFIGRLGPITVVIVFSRESRDRALEYPKEDVLIG